MYTQTNHNYYNTVIMQLRYLSNLVEFIALNILPHSKIKYIKVFIALQFPNFSAIIELFSSLPSFEMKIILFMIQTNLNKVEIPATFIALKNQQIDNINRYYTICMNVYLCIWLPQRSIQCHF